MKINHTLCFKNNLIKGIFSLICILLVFPLFAQEADKTNIRGERYCEIVLSKAITNYAIYNTLGLSDCPTYLWNKVTVAQVKKETGSSFVYLNGPRFWVVDGFNRSKSVTTPKTINGITMHNGGMLDIKLSSVFKAKSPYYKHEIKRQTSWLYEPGKPVYELIDPNGEVFVMQSYSIKKSHQTAHTLAQLGSKLKLPKGWVFKTGTLNQPESLKAINNISIIVQDDLDNTYQKASHDFLNKG